MATEITDIRGVRQVYGSRPKGGGIGHIKTEGVSNELTIDVTGDTLSEDGAAFFGVEVPAGSLITGAYVEVSEAFDLGGTTPTILVGTKGSEVTNGVVVTEAQAEAIGTVDITAALAGTWDEATLAADTEVGCVLGGVTPTVVAGQGSARIVVTYKKIA